MLVLLAQSTISKQRNVIGATPLNSSMRTNSTFLIPLALLVRLVLLEDMKTNVSLVKEEEYIQIQSNLTNVSSALQMLFVL